MSYSNHKQKSVVDSQTIKRRESKHATTKIHKFTKEGRKRGRNKETTEKQNNN